MTAPHRPDGLLVAVHTGGWAIVATGALTWHTELGPSVLGFGLAMVAVSAIVLTIEQHEARRLERAARRLDLFRAADQYRATPAEVARRRNIEQAQDEARTYREERQRGTEA